VLTYNMHPRVIMHFQFEFNRFKKLMDYRNNRILIETMKTLLLAS